MKITRYGQLAGVALVGTLALAACGSNDNTATSSASGSAVASSSIDCASGSLKASGSTAQANAMTDWINAYQTACSGATIDYQARRLRRRHHRLHEQADRLRRLRLVAEAGQRAAEGGRPLLRRPGASTSRWSAARSRSTYNVQGVTKLTLTSQAIAGIFAGKITKWNDPAITASNSGRHAAELGDPLRSTGPTPPAPPTTSPSSSPRPRPTRGRTAAASPGPPPAARAPRATTASAPAVKSTPNSIGYVELSYAQNNSLPVARGGQRRRTGRPDLGHRVQGARPARR